MGAAVLITLGVLFLLDEVSSVGFDKTFPALLIVIGVVIFLGRSASIEGHVQPFAAADATPPPIPSNPQGPEVNR
jgi:hypothetical protein